jgi:hypothetical protein
MTIDLDWICALINLIYCSDNVKLRKNIKLIFIYDEWKWIARFFNFISNDVLFREYDMQVYDDLVFCLRILRLKSQSFQQVHQQCHL